MVEAKYALKHLINLAVENKTECKCSRKKEAELEKADKFVSCLMSLIILFFYRVSTLGC